MIEELNDLSNIWAMMPEDEAPMSASITGSHFPTPPSGSETYKRYTGLLGSRECWEGFQPAKIFCRIRKGDSFLHPEVTRLETLEEFVGAPGATVASLMEWPKLWEHPEKVKAARSIEQLISYLQTARLDDWNSIAEALNFSLYLHKAPRKRFDKLVERWKADVRFLSDANEIGTHPSYQHIVGMGALALPFIFAELEKEPDHWFWALKAITGEDPVPEDDMGDLEAMTRHWLEWATVHRKRLAMQWINLFASQVYD